MALSCILGDSFYGDSCYGILLDPFIPQMPPRLSAFHALELDLIARMRRKDPSWSYRGSENLVRRFKGK